MREDQAPTAARPSPGATERAATPPTALPTPAATPAAGIQITAAPELAHAKRQPPAAPPSTAQALAPKLDKTWASGQEITVAQAAKGKTPRGSAVVVIDVPDPAKLPATAVTAASKSDGQLVWSLPLTAPWQSVMPQLTKDDPAPIIRIVGGGTTDDVSTAARQIKGTARKVRVEWVVPAQALPTDVTQAAAAAAAVDVIGLTIGPDDPWPATRHRLDTWATWAAKHNKRIALVHTVDGDRTWPSLVRAVHEWTAQQAKHRRIAYTAAHVTGDTTTLAARKALDRA